MIHALASCASQWADIVIDLGVDLDGYNDDDPPESS